MDQADRFLGGETDMPGQRRASAALALAHASRQIRDLMASAVEPGTPVAVTIQRARDGKELSSDHYLTLPNPLSLLIIGGSAYTQGDDITVVIQRAGLPTLRRNASWPFDLATAERLTRPDDLTTPTRPERSDLKPMRTTVYPTKPALCGDAGAVAGTGDAKDEPVRDWRPDVGS